MLMLAEEQLCGGYVRYLPVTKLDADTRRRALERFMGFRNRSVIIKCGFADDVWTLTDELSIRRIDFHIDADTYNRNALQWIGCTSDCYRECMKAYVSMLLGELSLTTLQIVVKDIAKMTGMSAEETLRGDRDKMWHRATFLAMIPFGNDIRDRVIEEMEELRTVKKLKASRRLPEFSYYLNFDRTIKDFWENADDEEKRIYFPVWFWWNLTSVLPLRATEFLMTPRECLCEKNGRYLLTIRRTRMKKKRKHRYKIREDYELHEYSIPKELYEEIERYRNATATADRTETETLLVPEQKVPSGYFTYCQMQRRLKKFCREVIGSEAYPIHMGDTRHLAMISLILSGGSPVVCRELAGHEDIEISSHYYANMSGVVESLVLERFRGWSPESGIRGENRYPMSVPEEMTRVKNGWCDCKSVERGDVSECVKAYVPGGELGDCLIYRHFFADRKGLQIQIERAAKKAVDDDGIYLMQMIGLVRKSLGYEEDIDQALLRIRGSADRYAKLFMRKQREEITDGKTEKDGI